MIKIQERAGELVNPTVFSTGPSTRSRSIEASGRVFVGGDEPPAEVRRTATF